MRTLEDIWSGIPKDYDDGRETRNISNARHYYSTRLVARCLTDFPFFCKHVLGLNFTYIWRLNDEFHFEPIKYIHNNRNILIIWPRGHLKTTIWSVAYSIWRLWKEKNIEICITSSALEQSTRIIENIEQMIEGNEFLQDLIPKDKQETWNKSQLNTENGNKCYQKPYGSTARGIHVDYLILDDILREENLSQEQIKDYFWSIFYPTVQTRQGQIVMVGTPMTMKDLFSDLSRSSEWKLIKKSCVKVDDSGKWLEPVWKERFSLEELTRIKEAQGSLVFEREYMCNPLGGGATIFKEILIGTQKEINKRIEGEEYFLGTDIAMKQGTKNDFLVFSILGRDTKTGIVYQRRLERYKGWNEDQIIKRIRELHRIFNFKKIIMENIGLSIGLVNTLSDSNKYPEISKVMEGYQTNRRGKEELISGINVGFETKTLYILDNTIQYNELIGFKAKEDMRSGKITYEGVGEHDDTVIALGLAMQAIISEQTGRASISFI